MSSSPFPYTCELCGAEGLTDEGMRSHTLEVHVAGRPECPFCDCDVPQAQLVGHVQRAHLHYLTPERELMAFIDDQSPSFDEDSKMTTTDSCSYNTPGSINGWNSPDISTSYQNGAISKNTAYHNGYHDNKHDKDEISRSPKNMNLSNGLKNVNISNGVVKKTQSRQNSNEAEVNGHHDSKGAHSSPSHNSGSYEGSPNKKLAMAGAGQGSPLRSQLALKLKANAPKKAPTPSPTVQCLLCDFASTCPRKLEEHINRAHFDLTSPSILGNANSNSNSNANSDNPTLGLMNPTITLTNTITLDNKNKTLASAMALSPGPHGSSFQCPICEREFVSGSDVEMHVNVEHRDILSPQKSEQMDNASCDDVVMMEESPVSNCPVCCQPLPLAQHELIQHIEEHFERGEDGGASGLSDAEREAQRCREEQEFQALRAQYGMEEDDEEAYSDRATNSLKRAVYSGALSVAGYYERSVGLRKASATGRDAGESRTNGLLERIIQLNAQNPSIVKTYLCTAVDHYASTYGDRGWGCGYRNMQMVLSSLIKNPAFSATLSSMQEPCECVPSIPKLQLLVEKAWQSGFDTQGSEQLGSKLYNTRKWIGACEVVTVLSSLRIRCQLIDFHKPTSADGAHPALFDWVLRYFTAEPAAFKAPLYLQHQGHSRTIIGYEKHKDGKATLLVLDPSHSPAQVRQIFCGNTAASMTALRLLRRNSRALRARQYQLLAVSGLIETDEEYEASKVLQSVRIP